MSEEQSNLEESSMEDNNDVTLSRSPEERRRICLGLSEKLLRFVGVWPESDPPPTIMNHISHNLFRIMAVKTVYYEALQCVNFYIARNNPFMLVEHAIGAEFTMCCALKYYTFYRRRREIRAMFDVLVDMHERDDVADKRVEKIRNEANLLTQFFGNYFLKCLSIASVIIILPLIPFSIINRKMSFMNWFPYDAYSTPWFEMTLLVEAVLLINELLSLVVTDITLALLVVHLVAQFKVLNCKIEHIRDTVLKIMKKKASSNISTSVDNQTSAMEVKSIQTVSLDRIAVCQLVLGDDREIYSVNSVMDNQTEGNEAAHVNDTMGRCVEEQSNEDVSCELQAEFNKMMEDHLHCCVSQHQALISLTQETNDLFAHILTNQVLFNVFIGICWLYVASLSSTVNSQFVLAMAVLSSGLLELGVISWLADMITEESLRVHEAAYDCDWLDTSEAFKSSLRIIMSRSQQALYIRAAGIPLSRKAAKTVCRAAYYLNMYLTRMYYGQKFKDGLH